MGFLAESGAPDIYPYGRSKIADVAELGKTNQAEVSGRCLKPGSAPTSFPQSPSPLLLRKVLPASSWSTGASGRPASEFSELCLHITHP